MDDTWEKIADLVAWLDHESVLPAETEKLLRIMKLSEETGEVAQAVIGAMGQNPRKGVSHTWDDVQAEVCDVVITAMVLLASITPDARAVFESHLSRVTERSVTR